MNQIIQWSKGNPGAMAFLMSLVAPDTDPVLALRIMLKLEKCASIRGTNLYVLQSDLGNKDLELIANICDKVPNNVLEDACSRQDYSGLDIIKPYL